MSTSDGFSDNPLCAEMERRCADMLLVSQAVVTCADVFEQACEPRAPKAEWFGTGEGQWDAWWIEGTGAVRNVHMDDEYPLDMHGLTEEGNQILWTMDPYQNCLPVAREGYPAPVGWKVVGE